MRITLLGTGTALPDPDREGTHMVVDSDGWLFLVDAGGEVYSRMLRAGLDPLALCGILLTHSHADHVFGFPVLMTHLFLAGRREPLPVYGTATTLDAARALVAASQVDDYALPPQYMPVEPGAEVPLGTAPVRLHTALTVHSRPALATRFEERATRRTVVLSADTEPCAAVVDLARGADLLLHEATIASPHASHSTPRQAGEVALEAGVGRLVLVHYSPRWTMPPDQALADVRAAGYTGPVSIGSDGQAIVV